MSENGSNGHPVDARVERTAVARAELEPLVRKMVPDVRSAMTITNALFDTYYNLRYTCMDLALNEAFAKVKARGVLYREALDALRGLCREMDDARKDMDPHHSFLRLLNVLQDGLPDRLVGEKGEIIWLADKQSLRPPLVQNEPTAPSEPAEPEPSQPASALLEEYPDPPSLPAK